MTKRAVLMIGALLLSFPFVAVSHGSNIQTLQGSTWQWIQFTDPLKQTHIKTPDRYTIIFGSGGTAQIKADCNRAQAGYTAEENGTITLKVGPMTRAMCPPDSRSDEFVKNLGYVAHFFFRNGHLFMDLMADGGTFEFSPFVEEEVPAAPEDGGPRNWEVTGARNGLNLREEPSANSKVLTRYPSGTILDNLGCKRAEGQIWCDVQKLEGGPRGFVSVKFLKPAISPDGSVSTGPDDSVLRAGQGKFDATGPIPCAEAVGQPMHDCELGVARAGGGYATVVVKKSDGRTRAIYFRNGKPVGADTSEADPGEFKARRKGDLNLISVGNERYEIPDVVVLGD